MPAFVYPMIGISEIVQNIIYFISLYYVVFWLLVFLDSEPEKQRRIKAYPEISIIIPAYNEQDNIMPTLKSVEEMDYPKDKLSIIMVDDGSSDNTYNVAKRYIDSLRSKYNYKSVIILHQRNSGKHEAMNLGLKHVSTPLFASLDADSFPEKDALKKIVSCFEDSSITAVSPVLKVFKPANYIQTIQWLEYSVNHFYKSLITKVNAIHVLPGPLSVYRTDIVKRIGCFRDAHKTEDMEIAMRLQMNGYRIMQCDDAFVNTKAPYTIKSLYKQRHRWNYGTFKNLIQYKKMMFNRKYGDFGIFQLPIILVSGFLGISIISLLIYDFFKSLKPTFLMLQQYNFNIIEYIIHSRFNIIWLDIDLKSVVTFIGFFAISIFILWMSFKMYNYGKNGKDSSSNPFNNPISFLLYLFFYYLFLAVVWLMVFRDIMLKKGTEWKGIRGK